MHVMDRIELRRRDTEATARAARLWLGVVALTLAAFLLPPAIARAAPPCGVTVSGDLLFGTYDVFSTAPLDTTATVRLTCPAARAPQVLIAKGNSSSFLARELWSGSEVLRYNLFLDPGRTQVWGDGTEGTAFFAPPKGNAQATIYARIPAGQDPAAGTYSDTLVITVFL
jgi:spore coat protein U-like protein